MLRGDSVLTKEENPTSLSSPFSIRSHCNSASKWVMSSPWTSWARDELQIEDSYLKPRSNSSDTSMEILVLSPCYRWETWNTERLISDQVECPLVTLCSGSSLGLSIWVWRSLPLVFHSSDRWHRNGLSPCRTPLHSVFCLAGFYRLLANACRNEQHLWHWVKALMQERTSWDNI